MENISPPFLVDNARNIVAAFQQGNAIKKRRVDSLALHDIGGLGNDMNS
jgi:hypothetical protein